MPFFSTLVGRLQLATVFIGIVVVALIGDSYNEKQSPEVHFFITSIIAMVLSVLLLLAISLGGLKYWDLLNIILHLVIAAKLGIMCFVLLTNIIHIEHRRSLTIHPDTFEPRPVQNSRVLIKKCVALGLQGLNAFMYLIILVRAYVDRGMYKSQTRVGGGIVLSCPQPVFQPPFRPYPVDPAPVGDNPPGYYEATGLPGLDVQAGSKEKGFTGGIDYVNSSQSFVPGQGHVATIHGGCSTIIRVSIDGRGQY